MNAIRLTNEQIETLKGVQKMLTSLTKYYEWRDEHGFSNIKFESVKDVSCALLDLAEATGYDYNFLAEVLEEYVADGNSYEEAFEHVACISYEKDW